VHEWFVIDATDKVLGRVASEVALRLRGRGKIAQCAQAREAPDTRGADGGC